MPTAVPITRPAAPASSDLAPILRPFLLIAAVAFVMGFAGYLAFGHPLAAVAQDRAQDRALAPPAVSESVSEPVADPSNRPIKT